jgi:hypothetical protein
MAWRVAVAALVLMLAAATLRTRLGNVAPFSHSLQFFRVTPFPNFAPRAANTALHGIAPGWLETLAAVVVFGGELAQQLGGRGAPWLLALVLAAALLWLGLACRGEWRRPSVPFIVLLAIQLFLASYYLVSFRTPASRLDTPFTAFDFHAHTSRSNGLMAPQQQINWHRARGFKGLAFTDTDTLMPPAQLAALRAANPDMLLLNGSEYHGDAHLILLGLKTAISSRAIKEVPDAIRAAKKQGALVIVAHPWSQHKYAPEQFLRMGADGFEAWNGVIWSRAVARFLQAHRLIATTATDTLSKSGSRCYTWTLLPPGMDDGDDVLRALRLRKTMPVSALGAEDTPAAYDARQARLKSFAAVPLAVGAAWSTLTRAQRINTLLGLVVAVAVLWAWGAQSSKRPFVPPGPQRAVGFLRRRRLGPRLAGLLLMLLAFLGIIGAALLTFGSLFKTGPMVRQSPLTPLHAMLAWLALDALYLYGRSLWQRTQ